ncbi:hypothetical protein Tco_1406212 [Tanacetum coccineum]
MVGELGKKEGVTLYRRVAILGNIGGYHDLLSIIEWVLSDGASKHIVDCDAYTLQVPTLKKNIGLFSGFVSDDDEVESLSFASQEKKKEKLKEKLDKCTKEKLFDFCDVLNLQIHKSQLKKEEVTVKLIDFLQSPNAMTEVMLAEKEHMDENNHIRIEVGNHRRVNAADNVIEEKRESEYDDMQQDGRPNPNKTMRKIGDG